MDGLEIRAVEAALRRPEAQGLTLSNVRLYRALYNRFGTDVDVVLEGITTCEGTQGQPGTPGYAPPTVGINQPTHVGGATAPNSTPAQESWVHRALCSETLRSGLEGLAATSVADPTTRSRLQAALAAVSLYCSGGTITRRVVLDAVCAALSLPPARSAMLRLGTAGVALMGLATAVCAVGPSLLNEGAQTPQLPAPTVSHRTRAAGSVTSATAVNLRATLSAMDPREAMIRALPYLTVGNLAELFAIAALLPNTTVDDTEALGDTVVKSALGLALLNAETQGDAAYILGGDGADMDDPVAPESKERLSHAVLNLT